jgi:ABC-type multidrug transport system fused ATPase/permease subunit
MLTHILKSFSILKRFEKFLLLCLSTSRALMGLFDLLGIALVGILISKVSQAPGESSLNASFLSSLQINRFSLTQIALATLFVFLAKSLLSVLVMSMSAKYFKKIETEKMEDVFRRFIGINSSAISSVSGQQLFQGLTYASGYAITSTFTAIITIVAELGLLVAIAIAFMLVSPSLTLGILVYFFLIGVVIQFILGRKFQKIGQSYTESAIASQKSIEDVLSAYKEIKILGKNEFFVQKYIAPRSQQAGASSQIGYLSAIPRYVVETALIFGAAGLVLFSLQSGSPDAASVTLGIFLTGGFRIMASMLPLQTAFGTLKQYSEQSQPFFDLLNLIETSESVHQKTKRALNHIEPNTNQPKLGMTIELKDVFFSYPNDTKQVLRGINLKVEGGEHIAIIGPSGSGKSTLVDLMLNLVEATSGNVFYDDIDIRQYATTSGEISYLPQSPGLISGSVAENIALGVHSSELNFESISAAINASNLEEVINHLPDGVHTNLGPQLDSLSGGELQRIGFARSVYYRPRLLILDEATSALDADSESAITSAVQLLGKDTTVITIAHRISTVQNADRLVIMENGQIVAQGNFSDLLKTSETLARYVELSEIRTTD